MAKALSHIMSTIRGSVGGLTYTANGFAQIVMKNRTAPVQPNTTPQTKVRSCLNAASIAWQGLTPTERANWELYAQTVTYEGPQGTYQITGRDIFIAGFSLQSYAYMEGAASQTVETDPPSLAGKLTLAGIEEAIYVGPGTGIGFNVNNYGTEDVTLIVNVSPPQNPTRYRYKGPWNPALTDFLDAPLSTSSNYEIDNLEAGRVYFVMIRGVTQSTPARVTSRAYLRLVAATVAP